MDETLQRSKLRKKIRDTNYRKRQKYDSEKNVVDSDTDDDFEVDLDECQQDEIEEMQLESEDDKNDEIMSATISNTNEC